MSALSALSRFSTKVGIWIARRLVRDKRRLLALLDLTQQRLDTLQSRLTVSPTPNHSVGLPIGSPAPDFDLPDLTGRQHRLADWHGHRLLLLFVDPANASCQPLVGQIAAMRVTTVALPLPVIVSMGSEEVNRTMAHQHGWQCPVLLQQEAEVAKQYAASPLPLAYLISKQGMIDSGIAEGPEAILAAWTRGAAPAATVEPA